MTRLTFLLACVFGVAVLTAGSARAEFDSGGAPTNPAQVQGNRPQVQKPSEEFGLIVGGQDLIVANIRAFRRAVPIPPPLKPAPAKKPLPKPPANARTGIPY
jgi:hypothetical protein